MAVENSIIVGGLMSLLFGLFGWVIKGSADKANDAMDKASKTEQNLAAVVERVQRLEETARRIENIRVDIETLKHKSGNIESGVRRLENHILEKK